MQLKRRQAFVGSQPRSERVRDPFRPNRSGLIELERDGEVVDSIEAAKLDAYRLQLENFADAAAGRAEPRLGRSGALKLS